MNLTEFVALLAVDFDAVLTLAGLMAVGIFAVVQTLKVLQIATTAQQVAIVALSTGGTLLVLVILGYFFQDFITIGLVIYGAVLALAVAVNGYKYAFKPITGWLFPDAEVSTESLS